MSNVQMRNVLVTIGMLAAAPALADATLAGSPSRPPPDATASVLLTSRGFGLSLYAPCSRPEENRRALLAELHSTPLDGFLELRLGMLWQLVSAGLFSVTTQLNGALFAPTRGPLDVGLGPEAGISVGLGGDGFEVFLGAQAGAEGFARGPGVRFPARLALGLRAGIGGFRASLVARAGADFEPGLLPTGRAEVALLLGWTVPP